MPVKITKMQYLSLLCLVLLASCVTKKSQCRVNCRGSISGFVIYSGKIPENMAVEMAVDPEVCGDTLTLEEYVINDKGRVMYAAVMLDSLLNGDTAVSAEAWMEIKDCRFRPRIILAPRGGTMKMKNLDSTVHTSHYYLVQDTVKKSLINQALPVYGHTVQHKKPLRKTGLVSVECDPHSHQQGWVWVLNHPYGAVTGKSGNFRIDNIPVGSHSVKIWHEKLGNKTVDVDVNANAETKIVVDFQGG